MGNRLFQRKINEIPKIIPQEFAKIKYVDLSGGLPTLASCKFSLVHFFMSILPSTIHFLANYQWRIHAGDF